MCAKYDELAKIDDDVLDKADREYEKEHGDYDKDEKRNGPQARYDYAKIARKVQRTKDFLKGGK